MSAWLLLSDFPSRSPKASMGAPDPGAENYHCAMLVKELQGQVWSPEQVGEQGSVLLPAPLPCQAAASFPTALSLWFYATTGCAGCWGGDLDPDLHNIAAASRSSQDVLSPCSALPRFLTAPCIGQLGWQICVMSCSVVCRCKMLHLQPVSVEVVQSRA